MEETELMIGDWMDWPKSPFANPHYYSQVVALEKGGISPCIGIPLTPEILEKNGFENEIGNKWCYGANVTIYFPTCRTEIDTDNDNLVVHPRYVHTLQHALRLCGLDELATNFKV